MKCLACGDHPLNYIHCDRWDCPLLLVRETIERNRRWRKATLGTDEMPEEDDEYPDQNDPA